MQKLALYVVEAYQEIDKISGLHKIDQKRVDSGFVKVFGHAVRIADKVGTTVVMPRITSRQQHRSNAPAISPCEYFQRNVAIPLLDHIIMFVDQQFPDSSIITVTQLGLIPSILCCSKPEDLNAVQFRSSIRT